MTAADESTPRRPTTTRGTAAPARRVKRARPGQTGRGQTGGGQTGGGQTRRASKARPAPVKPDASALLGVAWALATAVTLIAGSVLMGMWMAIMAGLAAVQAARSWKHRPPTRATQDGPTRLPLPPAAGAGALIVVLGAGFGVPGVVVAALAGVTVAGLWASQAGADVPLTVACAALPALAAAPPVLLRSTDGLVPAFVLLSCVGVYDAAVHVMGTGARWRGVGPVSGMLCIGSVTIFVAAIFPQFKGASPIELGVLVAGLAPCGPIVADRIVGAKTARVPALRRLDSLVVVAPVWALAAVVLVS